MTNVIKFIQQKEKHPFWVLFLLSGGAGPIKQMAAVQQPSDKRSA